jgi:hypothetical protein
VAGEKGRPAAVITCQHTNAPDTVAKLGVREHHVEVKRGFPRETRDDNIAKMAQWLLPESSSNGLRNGA